MKPITMKEALQLAPDLEERNNHDYGIDLEAARFAVDDTGVIYIDVDHPPRRIYAFRTGVNDAWSWK